MNVLFSIFLLTFFNYSFAQTFEESKGPILINRIQIIPNYFKIEDSVGKAGEVWFDKNYLDATPSGTKSNNTLILAPKIALKAKNEWYYAKINTLDTHKLINGDLITYKLDQGDQKLPIQEYSYIKVFDGKPYFAYLCTKWETTDPQQTCISINKKFCEVVRSRLNGSITNKSQKVDSLMWCSSLAEKPIDVNLLSKMKSEETEAKEKIANFIKTTNPQFGEAKEVKLKLFSHDQNNEMLTDVGTRLRYLSFMIAFCDLDYFSDQNDLIDKEVRQQLKKNRGTAD